MKMRQVIEEAKMRHFEFTKLIPKRYISAKRAGRISYKSYVRLVEYLESEVSRFQGLDPEDLGVLLVGTAEDAGSVQYALSLAVKQGRQDRLRPLLKRAVDAEKALWRLYLYKSA